MLSGDLKCSDGYEIPFNTQINASKNSRFKSVVITEITLSYVVERLH